MADLTQFQQWFLHGERQEGAPIPAATVVLVRDGGGGLETLMLHKSSKIAFGGMWVFPGGRIDDEDRDGRERRRARGPARGASARRRRRPGCVVDESSLAWISHWTPPAIAPKRYATWFFVAPGARRRGDDRRAARSGTASGWRRRTRSSRRDQLEMELAPPTWMTLDYLREFDDVDALMADARRARAARLRDADGADRGRDGRALGRRRRVRPRATPTRPVPATASILAEDGLAPRGHALVAVNALERAAVEVRGTSRPSSSRSGPE